MVAAAALILSLVTLFGDEPRGTSPVRASDTVGRALGLAEQGDDVGVIDTLSAIPLDRLAGEGKRLLAQALSRKDQRGEARRVYQSLIGSGHGTPPDHLELG